MTTDLTPRAVAPRPVGLIRLARVVLTLDLLALVGDVLLPDSTARGSSELVLVPELLDLAEPDVREAVEGWVASQGLVAFPVRPLAGPWAQTLGRQGTAMQEAHVLPTT